MRSTPTVLAARVRRPGPAAVMYQCSHIASPTPSPAANGTRSIHQRRDRHPIAHTSSTSASACIVGGTQPCINETSAIW